MSAEHSALNVLRSRRNFEVARYFDQKTERLNHFFETEKLDSVVIGLSGGIDSAVVLALLLETANLPNSALKKVVGIAMPIVGNGSTGQDAALNRARLLRDKYKDNKAFIYIERDLTSAYNEYISEHELDPAWSSIFPQTAFANGQLLSIVRTPFLYYTAALMQEQGFKSITCGTTNRDEGAYIGFFGKASDAMVDLQPIADIHKSEVYKIATHLQIPIEIINEKPRGDVYDNRVDEEMIGTSYDNVEHFALLKDYGFNPADEMNPEALLAINTIHSKNAHKYKVGLPARFVDAMHRTLEGGWQ